MAIILVEQLAKTYRFYRKEPGLRGSLRGLIHRKMLETKAVNDLSFTVEQGEIVGFLGPNGAGKTTTLKLLCGLLYPSSGRATVLGYTPHRREHAYLRQIALVMGQKNMLWWDIPAMETLLMHKEIYRLSAVDFKRTVDELADILEVAQLLRVQVRKLSLGERMKLELLFALVHRPQILFLDEPTIGLDVVAQQRVRDFLRTLNREHGTTILLTSHYMDDIEALCPRVMVIDHGQLQFDGKLSMLVEGIAPYKLLTAIFADPVEAAVVATTVPGLKVLPTDDPRRLGLHVPRTEVAEVAGRLLRLGNVVDLSITEVPVEDIIRQVFSAPTASKEQM